MTDFNQIPGLQRINMTDTCYMHHRNPQSLLFQKISLLHGYIITLKRYNSLKNKENRLAASFITFWPFCGYFQVQKIVMCDARSLKVSMY